jgi:hypothetical protein
MLDGTEENDQLGIQVEMCNGGQLTTRKTTTTMMYDFFLTLTKEFLVG